MTKIKDVEFKTHIAGAGTTRRFLFSLFATDEGGQRWHVFASHWASDRHPSIRVSREVGDSWAVVRRMVNSPKLWDVDIERSLRDICEDFAAQHALEVMY